MNDALLDLDGDGLSNLHEFLAGLNANVGDTDGDGSNDQVELQVGGLSGFSADSDSDGMSDAWELANGLNAHSAADAALDYNGLTYTVQTSTDLIAWTTSGPDVEAISTSPSGDGVTELVTVRIKPPLDDPGVKKFVQVLVTK